MMSSILRTLLLAEACLYVCGAPTHVPGFSRMQGSSCEEHCATDRLAHTTESAPLEKELAASFMLDVGAGGGTGPHGGPEGIGPVTQARNGVSARGRFGLSKAGRKETESEPEGEDVDFVKEDKPAGPTDGRQQVDTDMNTHTRTSGSFWASIAPQTDSSYSQKSKQGGTDATKSSAFDSGQDGYSEATLQSSPNTPFWSPKPVSLSPVPPLLLVTPRTSTQPSAWGHEAPTKSSPSDLLLPEIGPLNMMPRDDGLESLWTEAARPAGDTAVPLSQDEATEATMSSEALPLIFEPFEDATEEGPAGAAAAVAVVSQAPVGSPGAVATRLPPTSEADSDQLVNSDSDGPSREPPALLSEWTSPWQASGSELLESVGAGTAASQRQVQTEQEEDHPGTETVRTTNSEAGTSPHNTMTTIASHQLRHKSRTGIEEMDSEEELDEDEDDENSEESVEEDSEEDLTEAPETSSTQPPYSLIPPPPVWVQRNQGLMRSWAELIREKAGYVSGMLAPVGIGITGALLIVGALYSIRMLHRKRRNSFKHQRRKARQPEQPREPGTSCQDQAMLLADSSEDEF
ncbi:uncharacterized protein C14orf37 homolog isoform X2 [Poecilia reticulata]|uniref:uncharacterized protein C14orf37 homolog isoform X2 n=1 Tax=Poecilia reticulata TaxID=8081 RepID=UPI0007EBF784|nr:PREDICTED: uncharacterized protein C14orf37 homolog isoform X2 [Poecilia reticulata]